MIKIDNEDIGFFKFKGTLVENGYLDAKQSANVLLGLDQVFKYFLGMIDPELKEVDFSVPVKVQKGSWEALIPNDIEQWIKVVGVAGFGTYTTTALKKMAENDFGKIGFKDVLKEAFKAIKWVIALSSHLKTLSRKEISNAKFKIKNGVNYIGVPDQSGKVLFIPEKYLKYYIDCPERLFSSLAKAIIKGRELEIGLIGNLSVDDDDFAGSVKINMSEKLIFTKEDSPDDVLFPELKHGQYIELNGRVTRGNENTNTIGFEYQNHIIICSPVVGSIKAQKALLFTNCIIKGYVDREDRNGVLVEKKPKIRYVELSQIENPDNDQFKLF